MTRISLSCASKTKKVCHECSLIILFGGERKLQNWQFFSHFVVALCKNLIIEDFKWNPETYLIFKGLKTLHCVDLFNLVHRINCIFHFELEQGYGDHWSFTITDGSPEAVTWTTWGMNLCQKGFGGIKAVCFILKKIELNRIHFLKYALEESEKYKVFFSF